MNYKILIRVLLFCLLISIPMCLTYKTEYFKDSIESVIIGLIICLFSIYKSVDMSGLYFGSAMYDEVNCDIDLSKNFIEEFKFKKLVEINNISILRDVENRKYIWIKKSLGTIRYSIKSSIFPIIDSDELLQKSKLKFEFMIKKSS